MLRENNKIKYKSINKTKKKYKCFIYDKIFDAKKTKIFVF